ncbi:hypothetical protein H2275_02345 [Campylobacter sp. W0065]|uniref:hypothetical protein n=1 Tax=Campylobacter molothri TaxID=1032242 RepID=UPI00301D7006|nr:hypothetical protein [Campylobacter sp. W0065]
MKNIVLLGSSNSRVPGGLQAGLNQDDVNLVNLSIGATTSLYKLYSLKREENQEVLKKADLIIIESNIVDIFAIVKKINLCVILKNIDYLYDELALFKTKVIILILFDHRKERMIINNFHKYKAKEYGYNVIDINNIVNKFNLNDFYMKPDPLHMLTSIMYELGKNIASNISCFHFPYKNKQYNHQFDIITPDQLEILNGELDKKIIKDLIYKEIVYKINKNHIFKIPERYNGFRLIGIHTFNNDISLLIRQNNMMSIYEKRMKSYSSLILEQKREKLIKFFWGYNTFQDISNSFILDKNTLVKLNLKEKYSELSLEVDYINNHINTLDYVNLVSLFVVKEDPSAIKNINYDWLYQAEINIDEKYNFDHLIPDLLLVKESVEEYCIKMDPIKLKPLQNQINASNFAKTRIQNELPYKLGQAMIMRSKSFSRMLSMPAYLISIFLTYRLEQKVHQKKIEKDPFLALPPLESYPDYHEALKERECFTYKLGEALIKANNNWYGAGYIKLWFEIRKLRKEFKKSRK